MSSIEVIEITKIYSNKTQVLDKFSYAFEKGKFYGIMGRSGAGKSTLLNILGTIDTPISGEAILMRLRNGHLTKQFMNSLRI